MMAAAPVKVAVRTHRCCSTTNTAARTSGGSLQKAVPSARHCGHSTHALAPVRLHSAVLTCRNVRSRRQRVAATLNKSSNSSSTSSGSTDDESEMMAVDGQRRVLVLGLAAAVAASVSMAEAPAARADLVC